MGRISRHPDRGKTMKLKLAAVAVLAAVGVGALVYTLGGVDASAADTPEYLTSPATVGDVTDDIAATGTIAATARTGVGFGLDPWRIDDGDAPAAPATYRVTEVSVEVGGTVAEGDPLATAESADLALDLTTAKNDLASAKVSLRAAEDDLEDAEDADVTAQIRQAKIALNNAENGVATAEAKVDDLKAQIAGATLLAPVAGVVTEVNVTVGFDAPAGAAIVIDAPSFQVTTDVVESDLADVEAGQTAAITIAALDADVTGTVTAISPITSSDGGSGVVSFPVTVTLDEAPADLHAGMSADVTITIASATDVLTVPSAALLGAEGDYRVRTLDAEGSPVVTPVEVGLLTSTTAEITSGLTEGTAVVTGTASDLAGTIDSQNGGFGGPGGGVAIPGNGPVFRQENGGPVVTQP
jgi:RND family efflux transporter MFP subunit